MRVLSFIILNFKISASSFKIYQCRNGTNAEIGEGTVERKVQTSKFKVIILK